MFSCPTDDIHSIYLDRELPAAYVDEYEAHVKVCASCAEKLKRLRRIQGLFRADAASVTPDSHYVEQGYERLAAKLRYAKNTGSARPRPDWFRLAVPAAAAAALLALVIPSRRKAEYSAPVAMAAPVTRPKAVSIPRQNVVINGNITRDVSSYSPDVTPVDMDVFRPEFDDSGKLWIKILIPALGPSEAGREEIRLPADAAAGPIR